MADAARSPQLATQPNAISPTEAGTRISAHNMAGGVLTLQGAEGDDAVQALHETLEEASGRRWYGGPRRLALGQPWGDGPTVMRPGRGQRVVT